MKGGRFYVVSAPSGTGKTTVLKRLMKELPEVTFSVSYTTRPSRQGEMEGVDYHFISRDEFEAMKQKGAFAEWTEVHGSYYGTSRASLEKHLSQGGEIILDIDTRGVEQIQEKYPNGVYVFLLPPRHADLRDRLTRRGSESQEMIDLRLQNASKEIEKMDRYDYVVVNKKIDETVEQIRSIIIAERSKRDRVVSSLGGNEDR